MCQVKVLAQAYLDEERWLDQGYTPSFEEYMHISMVTTAVPVLVAAAMIGMGDDFVTKDMFEWVFSDPKISKATKTITRLMDDMGTYKVLMLFFWLNTTLSLKKGYIYI